MSNTLKFYGIIGYTAMCFVIKLSVTGELVKKIREKGDIYVKKQSNSQ